ncbi:MAG: hypothetical protein AB1489_29900 [Acidobacteriota bacterium]
MQREDRWSRALAAFLDNTKDNSEPMRALRALTLHMLAGHAPEVFRVAALSPILDLAVQALADIPLVFPKELNVDIGMARIDAWYVLHQRGLPGKTPDICELSDYLKFLDDTQLGIYAWLLGKMAQTLGVNVELDEQEQTWRELSRQHDLYYLTHILLLKSCYLQEPLPRFGWQTAINRLLASVDWLIEEKMVDLGAEVAICLQLAGQQESLSHQALLDLIAICQQPDGTIVDPTMADSQWDIAHTTAAALLALAGAA